MQNRNQDDQAELKAIAFKKIYKALRSAQRNSQVFKSDFLLDKEKLTGSELLVEIKVYCEKNPKSRTAKAWDLTEKYYHDCNAKNPGLVNEIYQYACENTRYFGTKFFSSLASKSVFTNEQVESGEYGQDIRGFYISYELGAKDEDNSYKLTS